MQTGLQREGTRRRLATLIRERFGDVNPASLAELAAKARVHYTSLARYLLYPASKRTTALRQQTLSAVAMALDTNPVWLRDGQGAQQLGVWPLLTPSAGDCSAADPEEQIEVALTHLRALKPQLRVRAYRAAIAAAIEVVTAEGENPGDETYRCLIRLDALRRSRGVRVAS
jgi:hypothetical protein